MDKRWNEKKKNGMNHNTESTKGKCSNKLGFIAKN